VDLPAEDTKLLLTTDPEDAKRQRRKALAAEHAEKSGIEAGISRESAIEVRAETVVAIEFGEKLEDRSSAEPADCLYLALAPKLLLREGLRGREGSIKSRPLLLVEVFPRRRFCTEAALFV
jgi:hypothetical protein